MQTGKQNTAWYLNRELDIILQWVYLHKTVTVILLETMGRMPLDAMHKNAPASFRVTFRIVIDVPLPVRNRFIIININIKSWWHQMFVIIATHNYGNYRIKWLIEY